MKILVACEESQRVCIEFRKRGHEVYSCDIEPCSGGHPEWHIMQDVLPLLNGNIRTCNKRNRSPAGICKHMLLQLADNDEIEETTGKRRSDYSVVKKQKYNNQNRRRSKCS